MGTRSGWLKLGGAVLGVVVLVAVVGVGVAVTTFERPTVEGSEYAWGEVTDATTEIDTTVVVNNPNPVGLPGIVDVSYTATLNDVTLATGQRSGVGFGTGTNTIDLTAEMRNERIAAWWVSHVNGGEESTLRIDATVAAPGFSKQIPAKEERIETDILGGFTQQGERTVTVQNDTFLRVSDQSAAWGEATAERTPITFASTIENAHDYPVTLDGVEYVVTMNGVELGRDRKTTGVAIEPGQRDDLDVTVALDTPKMADWWAEHVRDDETSDLTVAMYGIVEQNGEQKRIPIRLFDETLRLETDMLGGSGTNVTNVGSPRAPAVAWPEVTETSREWGTVTDATTEIESTSTIDAPDNDMTDVLTLAFSQETTINDVTVASGSQRVSALSAGANQVELTAEMDNGEVPTWWARHLNRGERSTVRTTPTALADVGFTKFDVTMNDRESTVETDLLAGMNGDRNEKVTISGQDALTVRSVQSEWGEATAQTAPIDVEATVENDLPTRVEVSKVEYTVSLNDVVLADKTTRNVDAIGAESTGTVSLTMALDNQQMDEWWVTHVRNDEQSSLDVSVVVTVDSRAGSATQELDSLGQSTTIETDVLDSNGN
ncbi:LEA type 2 family protein [Halorientalis brevis]|uniref:LEA type 2 family protein n=1 Tax=Halorientalis brevis TaxID=1126241 RepID=A0ABD6C7J0_9EURY|nr:LEA type 2 family protein [Halorientalis brevis]